jgi:hypothetical protein
MERPRRPARPAAPVPLNDKPLSEPVYVHAGAEAGKQQCFAVRSVAAVGGATIESDPSAPVCITPKDTFPPAAPKGLAAVGSAGVINLIWDASPEADLAGYVILRAEAPGATLQPLVREPIRETRYGRPHRPAERAVCLRRRGGGQVRKPQRTVEQGGRSRAIGSQAMKIFIDTGNIQEIQKLVPLGIIDGITTNPSLLAKESGDYKEILKKICQIVQGPTSAEVVETEAEAMIKQGAISRRSIRGSS